jgi:uncharacterized protein YqfA (UPF0365 family)
VMLKRALAVLVLVIVAIVAIRVVIGVVSAVLWIVALAVLVAAGLWAWGTLRSAKRKRSVKRQSASPEIAAPAEDPVAAEMRRITEQLREQGRA